MNAEYLGDSVYAELEDGMIKLYLNNGEGGHSAIRLEPEVFEALLHFAQRIGWRTDAPKGG
jgi:hypothetical protein